VQSPIASGESAGEAAAGAAVGAVAVGCGAEEPPVGVADGGSDEAARDGESGDGVRDGLRRPAPSHLPVDFKERHASVARHGQELLRARRLAYDAHEPSGQMALWPGEGEGVAEGGVGEAEKLTVGVMEGVSVMDGVGVEEKAMGCARASTANRRAGGRCGEAPRHSSLLASGQTKIIRVAQMHARGLVHNARSAVLV
jgi:hypothetical protein